MFKYWRHMSREIKYYQKHHYLNIIYLVFWIGRRLVKRNVCGFSPLWWWEQRLHTIHQAPLSTWVKGLHLRWGVGFRVAVLSWVKGLWLWRYGIDMVALGRWGEGLQRRCCSGVWGVAKGSWGKGLRLRRHGTHMAALGRWEKGLQRRCCHGVWGVARGSWGKGLRLRRHGTQMAALGRWEKGLQRRCCHGVWGVAEGGWVKGLRLRQNGVAMGYIGDGLRMGWHGESLWRESGILWIRHKVGLRVLRIRVKV